MRELIIRIIINTLSLYTASNIIQIQGFNIDSWKSAIIGALVLSLLNMIVKPVLKVISFPITIATLGLFTLIINAAILSLAAHYTPINIASFGVAIKAALVISLINWALGIVLLDKKKRK